MLNKLTVALATLSSRTVRREEEGRDLLGKRTMDFKVTYLDAGLTTSSSCSSTSSDRNGGTQLSENDFILRCQRNRRYKSQIRDLLSRGKRKTSPAGCEVPTPPPPYLEDYGNVYAAAAPYTADNGLAGYGVPQNLFLDNSRFLAPENFLHYRHLSGYYTPEYPQYGNGFLDPTARWVSVECSARIRRYITLLWARSYIQHWGHESNRRSCERMVPRGRLIDCYWTVLMVQLSHVRDCYLMSSGFYEPGQCLSPLNDALMRRRSRF